jgi:hypothetical protein
MKVNMSAGDRMIRLVGATLIPALYFSNIFPATVGIVLLIVAIILLVTSLSGLCLLYLPFGFDTNHSK